MIWPIAPAIAAGSARVTGSSELARSGSWSGMSGTPVERFDGRTLPVEQDEPRKRNHEAHEKERRPVEPEVMRIGGIPRRGTDIDAPERCERGEQRVLRGREAMIAERHEERHEGRRPHAAGEILQPD